VSAAPHRRAATPGQRHLAELGVLLVMVVWAGNFIVIKRALDHVPPVGFTLLRFALASAVLLVILRWREGSISMPRRDALPIIGLGVMGFGIYQILWTTALGQINAGDSAVLIATTPVLTAVLAVAARADTLTPAKLGGSILSFIGVGLVIAAGPGFGQGGALGGYVLTLIAALCWAAYTAFGAPFLARQSPLRTTTWATVAGTLTLFPIGAAQLLTTPGVELVPEVWLTVLYAGMLAAGLGNVLVFHGVHLLGPTRVTAMQTLVPALAVVLAFLVLNEAIRPGQVLGGAVIIGGVALTRLTRTPARLRRS
jgi:drug/metabolite transporter (DMT)-like permease